MTTWEYCFVHTTYNVSLWALSPSGAPAITRLKRDKSYGDRSD